MWSVAYDSILCTTSIPRATSPNTTFRRSHHGAGTVVMKNYKNGKRGGERVSVLE